ncbi:hypothetical protein GOBAR_AA06295 [Gossypium barbadense]|uniref:Uncharacterized protein n=1 Tax=Gossypium barbadense TaxID=3634 RepID=A0A2P5YFB7_GOSBA|nr:hypothetical protein GOBAR_AA06295 [Gossypium barbadense]
MVQPILQEMSLKEIHDPFSSNSRGPIHEERRLQIEKLDEWWTPKLRTHDKPKLRQNELNTFPNQLQVGDKVLLDTADPHIVTTKPNEEVPLTILRIFPLQSRSIAGMRSINSSNYHDQSMERFSTQTQPSTRMCLGPCRNRAKISPNRGYDKSPRPYTMSSSHGKKAVVPTSKKRKGALSSSGPTAKIRHPFLQLPIRPQEELFQILWARPLILGRCINWATVEQVQLADVIRALLTTDPWTVMTRFDDPGTVQFHLGNLICLLSVPEFGTTLGLYTEEFLEKNELHALNHHIDHTPSKFWHALAPGTVSYNPSRSKASGLLSMEGGNLYWALCDMTGTTLRAPRHRGPRIILDPHWPDVSTRHLEHAKHENDRKAPRNLPSSISSRQSTEEEDPDDITDDVPPQHEDPPSQPPPPSRPVHAAASYADISECLIRFKQ